MSCNLLSGSRSCWRDIWQEARSCNSASVVRNARTDPSYTSIGVVVAGRQEGLADMEVTLPPPHMRMVPP
jgi:hypothetical protein